MIIDSFSGEYGWLSNFYPSDFWFNHMKWKTVEHAYVAFKAPPNRFHAVADRIETLTAGQAKRYGRTFQCREDFDSIKLNVMQALVLEKFGQNEYLKQKLLATGNCEIIEGNDWGDTYFGICKGVGENHLGRIIMGVRRYYAKSANIPDDEHAVSRIRRG